MAGTGSSANAAPLQEPAQLCLVFLRKRSEMIHVRRSNEFSVGHRSPTGTLQSHERLHVLGRDNSVGRAVNVQLRTSGLLALQHVCHQLQFSAEAHPEKGTRAHSQCRLGREVRLPPGREARLAPKPTNTKEAVAQALSVTPQADRHCKEQH